MNHASRFTLHVLEAMSPAIAQAALRIALFITLAAGFTLLCLSPERAEFAVSVFTLGIGLAMLGVVVLLIKIERR
ncbi:MAG: hypothetical protein HY300_18230 [Verrucomicrobia bacterium]|nr:hypothetical protein [Verrucomicrobiota bacterium]